MHNTAIAIIYVEKFNKNEYTDKNMYESRKKYVIIFFINMKKFPYYRRSIYVPI